MNEKTGKARRRKSRSAKKNGARVLMVGLSALAASALPAGRAAAQSVNCFQSLSFGTAVTCGVGGTVKVDPQANRTTTGCISAMGPSSQGRCLLKGTFFPVTPMVVSMAAATYTISNGAAAHMNVNGFKLATTSGATAVTVTAFQTNINIGATLNVGGPQASGSYSGTSTINVNYQ